MSEDWKLYYWPSLPGRGDFVRLMFEELGIQYEDIGRTKGIEEIIQKMRAEDGWPVSAPPIVQNGDFTLNQTPAILEYLGKKYDAYPKGGLEEEAHAMQINLTVCDLMQEGHDSFHPIEKAGSYDSQKEAAVPYIKKFKEVRLLKYLKSFARALKMNESKGGFFIGDKLTYVDIAVFQALRAVEFQFPEEYDKLCTDDLKAFKERMACRPNIAAFLKSPRSIPFCGNSMM